MKRLKEIFLDSKTLAVLLGLAVAAILTLFNIAQWLPDSIKQRATPALLTPIVTLLLWIFFAALFSLLNFLFELRRHPDGKPKPGKVAIYVAELKGDKENSHRNHILLTLKNELGDAVQILRAGKEFRAKEKGNPDDDALAANRKGQKYLSHKKYKGDLLIWGKVIKEEKLVELRFTSPVHDGADQKRFTFTEKMLLAQDFGPELAAVLAAIAAKQALPSLNPGKYVADVLIPVAEKLGKIIANLPASMTPDQRGLLLDSYANAELTIGDQRGDFNALNRAITAFGEVLNEYTRERVPLNWAKTKICLGIALRKLGEREDNKEYLEAAVAAYREALMEYTREKVPLEWALTQNNLGNALSTLGERESSTEQLKAAVAAFREALKERTWEKVPLDWAMTQHNLGIALRTLGECENNKEYLEAAVAAYRKALIERTWEKVPLDWAMTQHNLGSALLTLGKRESGTEYLKASVAAIRAALKERTQEKVPLQWAATQNNLGNALSTLGERESRADHLEAAVAAYREALKEYTREKVPLQWAMTHNNLGGTLGSLGELDDAANSFRLALEVFTPENHFLGYTAATNNLARVQNKLLAAHACENPQSESAPIHTKSVPKDA